VVEHAIGGAYAAYCRRVRIDHDFLLGAAKNGAIFAGI
jgi:hypothetical protein